MKGIIALVLLALVAGVCCETNLFISRNNRPQPISSEEISLGQISYDQNVRLTNVENPEFIRSMDIFKAKVNQRLNTSMLLANHPDMKGRLMNIAVNKYKSCETSNNELQGRDVRSCLGFATAQMMSLIRNIEKNPSLQLSDFP